MLINFPTFTLYKTNIYSNINGYELIGKQELPLILPGINTFANLKYSAFIDLFQALLHS
jgi:hypothetical protein